MYVALYKYNYRRYDNSGEPIGPDLEFNYYSTGFVTTNGQKVKCIDSIIIYDILPDTLTGIDWGLRKHNDIKLIDMGRFSLGFDLDNDARSHNGKSIDEFLATEELIYRQIYCVYQYGNIAYEGWLDQQSIIRDKTHTEKKWDINFEVDGPMSHFFDSMDEVTVLKVPAGSSIRFIEYFRDYHFNHWFNNGSVTEYKDRTGLQQKLGWTDEGPVVSSPLQRGILYSSMNVKDATKSLMMGLGFIFEMESIRPYGYEALHKLPFRINIRIEGDADNTVTVNDVTVHQQGYSKNNNQHFILPYWKLSSNPAQIEAYYHGLFMSANALHIENHDLWGGGYPIILYNAGARSGLYEITGAGYYARKKDTYLLDVEYREPGLFTVVVQGENYNIGMAYFRIFVKSWTLNPQNGQYRDFGFEEIIGVTAQNVYKYMCGQLKEKHFITVPYEVDTEIKPNTLLESEQIGNTVKVERIKKLNIKKREADLDTITI